MNIVFIKAEETVPLRQKVLRPGQPVRECRYEADEKENTFHLGCYIGETLISIASFYEEAFPLLTGSSQYRLRGMATLPEYRSMKAGSSLLQKAEEVLSGRNADLWWCNARTTVEEYYQKQGLQKIGNVFELEGIGPHQVMYKRLKGAV
ncbi:GNAT family N-acetyltransferase [Bacillus sp. FJAT-42376]|uniref:GNAT family N-acetyltransferase n=1 Tax=Bacillus sp. FJAT-42376 TaxID=2014076 RepID=UPI000F4E87B7|nr:GNAT family N-acetyltransferase [Bacillus sp. FJAT-42376]AZB44469.1 GNAT family N-acetyltransferase [Bacillus sp. FJAT-42376]